jgi:tRNA pseudouridine55 synthase
MDGIVILDKPKGMTSQRAVERVKKILKAKCAGHTGTLDPFATGVLPVCLGKSTKVIPFLDEDFKEYEAVLKLGIETDTMDETGSVINEKAVGGLDEYEVRRVFMKFVGEIKQIPPMFSALKKDGVRLYRLARQGREVPRTPRTVLIRELSLLDLNPPFIRFFVRCSRGTYVRVLGSDIGKELGLGGHLLELRRIKSGAFGIEGAVSMEDVEGGHFNLISMNEALSHMREINITEWVAAGIRDGKQIRKSDLNSASVPAFDVGARLRICENRKLVSIAQALVGDYDLDKLDDREVVFRLLRVFN